MTETIDIRNYDNLDDSILLDLSGLQEEVSQNISELTGEGIQPGQTCKKTIDREEVFGNNKFTLLIENKTNFPLKGFQFARKMFGFEVDNEKYFMRWEIGENRIIKGSFISMKTGENYKVSLIENKIIIENNNNGYEYIDEEPLIPKGQEKPTDVVSIVEKMELPSDEDEIIFEPIPEGEPKPTDATKVVEGMALPSELSKSEQTELSEGFVEFDKSKIRIDNRLTKSEVQYIKEYIEKNKNNLEKFEELVLGELKNFILKDYGIANELYLSKSGKFKSGIEGIIQMQKKLNQTGNNLIVDGVFGPNTFLALIRYQIKNNLDVDGICGPETIEKLFY